MTGASQLTVAYSSLARRAPDIRPPAAGAVEVIVCVQGAWDGMELPRGVDRVVRVPGVGVARSRNAAIDHAGRRYLLFCDDDVEVDLPGVLAGVAFLRRTGAALALGRAVDPEGRYRKDYPSDRPCRLTRFNSAKAATYEMLVDTRAVRAAGLRFDERFGAGVETYLGDEYLFIADLLRSGLPAYAVPYVFGTHPPTSSGTSWGERDARVRATVLNHVFGRSAPVARLLFGVRRRREIGSLGRFVRFALDGTTLDPPAAASSPLTPAGRHGAAPVAGPRAGSGGERHARPGEAA